MRARYRMRRCLNALWFLHGGGTWLSIKRDRRGHGASPQPLVTAEAASGLLTGQQYEPDRAWKRGKLYTENSVPAGAPATRVSQRSPCRSRLAGGGRGMPQ